MYAMKTRIIHTRFWTDTYIQSLNPTEKLLFNFLLTNEHVNMVGAFEMTISYMQYCTGIPFSNIQKILEKFTNDNKIIFQENYVVLINHLKYQDYSKGSERQKSAFEREKKLLPDTIVKIVDNRDNLTSSKLVKNQSVTIHKLKYINHKSKIINHKSKNAEKILKKFNEVLNKNFTSTSSWEKNYEHWSKEFTEDQILKAIENIPRHPWLSTIRVTPTIFFRTDKDWIDQCLNSELKQKSHINYI